MADNFTPSNISYTNKDFQSIYNELLELIPKLTNKWDPSLSNESDPLVVLLKLNALLADKNNYNIDKNILELFPVSVTQRGNAQKIYESLGYSMAWYRSAITEVAFRWIGKTSEDITQAIKVFDMVTDASGEVVYTLIPEDGREIISIDKSGKQDIKVLAMEGTCNDYILNGNNIITLDNLDADLRLYFTDSKVAENGIFIANAPSDTTSADWKEHLTWLDWVAVDNLEATDLGQKVYKFGVLPNSNTCYIQFPQDIANLIGQGLVIKYLISSGSAGTIKAKTLDSLFSDIKDTDSGNEVVINDNIRLWNPSDSTTGQDPESLDDAYRNYKKLVTTFNTLVTCKDYESAIYRLTDDNDLPIVSNVVVSDRSNDYIAGTTLVKASSPSGNYDYVYSAGLDPFDIKFYVLKPANTINTAAQYNDSFNTDATVVKEVSDTLDISDYKSTQHNIKTPLNQNPFIYKAKYTIKCKLTTYNKVSQNQAKSICNDVELALYRKYSARNIDFGESISYDDIIDTIKSANKAIKDVILNDIDYNVVSMDADNTETSIATVNPTGHTEAENIRVKNILAGRSQGLKFNTEFNYNLEQSNGAIYPASPNNKIESISGITSVVIPATADGTYTIKDNEIVTLFGTSYKPVVTYSTYLYYQFSEDTALKTPADSYYQIVGENETLKIGKENINNIIQTDVVTYGKGTIFKLSGFTENIKANDVGSLGSTKTITIYKPNEITIPKVNGNIKCYWITNNPQNTLFDFKGSAEAKRYLYEGEYFIYTNSEQTEVSILGAGTLLTATGLTRDFPTLSKTASSVDVTDIGVSSINWVSVPSNVNITAQENQIINLTSPVTLKCPGGLNLSGSTTHEEVTIPAGFTYNGNTLPELPNSQSWVGLSRLKVVGDTNTPMQLYAGQSLTLKYKDSIPDDSISGLDGGKNILFNQPVALQAGDNVDAGSLLSNGEIEYNLKLYTYDISESNKPKLKIDGYNIYEIKANIDKEINIKPIADYNYMFKAYWIPDTTADLELSADNNIKISNYAIKEPVILAENEKISISPYTANNNRPIYCISFSASAKPTEESKFIFSSTSNGNLYISNLLTFDNPDAELGSIIGLIRSKPDDIRQRFDFTHQVSDTDLVENPTSGESLLDPNNIMNKFTIAQINTDTLDISVSKSSLL